MVKLGEGGVFYATSPDAGGERGFAPAFEVNAIDTVAAGDAFAAGVGVALARGLSLSDAVTFGSAAGALAVTKSGAQQAMPYANEVNALLTAAPPNDPHDPAAGHPSNRCRQIRRLRY